MKRIIMIVILTISMLLLTGCAEADAIKNGIKDKLPKPEVPEIIEAVMDAPKVEIDSKHTLLVVQEIKNKTIIAIVPDTGARYSIPSWFGNANIEPGTYIYVHHAEQSLATSPLQFGFIYGMNYYAKNGTVVEGVKP